MTDEQEDEQQTQLAKEKALTLCQKFGKTTIFAKDCNNGYSLPLRVAKLCAHIAVDELMEVEQNYRKYFLLKVKAEIDKI